MAATLVGPVSAQNAKEVRLLFSPVGIARGQTAVFSVVLVALPPSPCQATPSFYDSPARCSGPERNRP